MSYSVKKDGPKPVDIEIGTAIRFRRKQRGMSQEALATAVNLTFQQIQKYERGSNRVSGSMLFEIAAALEVPVESLFPQPKEAPALPEGTPLDAVRRVNDLNPRLIGKAAQCSRYHLAKVEGVLDAILTPRAVEEVA